MFKSVGIKILIFGQSLGLFSAGLFTMWYSDDLMSWLIWLVGEEYALGEDSVIMLENGSKLLTNPTAMLIWTLPIWALGLLQISAAVTLVWLGLKWGDSAPMHVHRIGEGRNPG